MTGLTLWLGFACMMAAADGIETPAAITNHYDPAAERPRLDDEKTFLYEPVSEWT